jgi:hypothetical protein
VCGRVSWTLLASVSNRYAQLVTDSKRHLPQDAVSFCKMVVYPDGQDLKAIRDALGSLIAYGLVPFNVAAKGGPVLELAVVQAHIPAGLKPSDDEAYENAAAAAVTEVLETVVSGITSRNYRVVLRYVLPLASELLGTDVTHRRREAGKALKRGRKPIKANSVRTYYEGEALDQLAEDLLRADLAHRRMASSRS